jgi:hypothetical protein
MFKTRFAKTGFAPIVAIVDWLVTPKSGAFSAHDSNCVGTCDSRDTRACAERYLGLLGDLKAWPESHTGRFNSRAPPRAGFDR